MMTTLSLKNKFNNLPLHITLKLWEFIRENLNIKDFEQWIYASDNLELKEILTADSYLTLISLDYRNEHEVKEIKFSMLKLLTHFKASCLCHTFANKTRVYPFIGDEEYPINKQIEALEVITTIKDFSGRNPLKKSQWYHPAQLCYCSRCETNWFVIFEESDCDYYLIRLTQEEVLLISQCSNWPNESWPIHLRNWQNFLNQSFCNWNNLYENYQLILNQIN